MVYRHLITAGAIQTTAAWDAIWYLDMSILQPTQAKAARLSSSSARFRCTSTIWPRHVQLLDREGSVGRGGGLPDAQLRAGICLTRQANSDGELASLYANGSSCTRSDRSTWLVSVHPGNARHVRLRWHSACWARAQLESKSKSNRPNPTQERTDMKTAIEAYALCGAQPVGGHVWLTDNPFRKGATHMRHTPGTFRWTTAPAVTPIVLTLGNACLAQEGHRSDDAWGEGGHGGRAPSNRFAAPRAIHSKERA